MCAIPADETICLMKSCQELEEKKLSTVVDLQLARQQVVEAVKAENYLASQRQFMCLCVFIFLSGIGQSWR